MGGRAGTRVSAVLACVLIVGGCTSSRTPAAPPQAAGEQAGTTRAELDGVSTGAAGPTGPTSPTTSAGQPSLGASGAGGAAGAGSDHAAPDDANRDDPGRDRTNPDDATAVPPGLERPAPAATETSGVSSDPKSLAIFYLTDTGAGLRLAREFHSLPSLDEPASRAQDALIEMLHGRPRDSDYASPWPRDTLVRDVRVGDGTITVDLAGTGLGARVGDAAAELAVQQLVYTATAAVGRDDPVRLLIDGRPARDLWGGGSWTEPVRRAPESQVRLLAQVDLPADRSSVGRRFVVTGSAATLDGAAQWSLVTPEGRLVTAGTTQPAAAQRLSPFRFEVSLPAGEPDGQYVLSVQAEDPLGARPPMRDDRTLQIG